MDADAGLWATNKWLDTENEIMEKAPQLDSEKIKVCFLPQTKIRLTNAIKRDGKLSGVKMVVGWPQQKLSMPSESICAVWE